MSSRRHPLVTLIEDLRDPERVLEVLVLAYRSIPRRLSSANPPQVRRVFSAPVSKPVEPEPAADLNGEITAEPKRRRKSKDEESSDD